MSLFNIVFYGITTVIALVASYVNITDEVSQPIISIALGMCTGTHFMLFLKGFRRDI